ncbi:bacteriophage protein [Enterobacter cancerogenus]|uniref:Bacteriophage protein n=1 Tax=Enterobacter cancerogenus TaxID=69218 RepID=A0A484Z3X1_9ENTR|nr:bacteriophage protein [Enterobacter cancerogenus]
MKLTPIIAALRARCPLFENRVGGAAQFKAIPEAESSGYQLRMLCQPKTSRASRNRRRITGRI